MVPNLPQWGINPVPPKHRILGGFDYFILWSSLGVGLLVFSAGSFLSDAPFYHALLAIIIGSITGSVLLSMAGKIGSDHAVPSIIGIRPAFGLYGSYLAAVLNIIQLIGWTTFEILILSKAAEQLTNMNVTFVWNILFGVVITLLGIFGPLFVVKQWLSKFAIWIVYASSIIISIQAIFFGFILLVMIVDEIDNAFADIYSAAISSQNIFHNLNQRHLIIRFSAVSTILAIFVSIEGYEQFLFLIGALFIPLFGVLLTDYFVISRGRYQHDMMYGNNIIKIGYPAIVAWFAGALTYYLLSQLSPIYLSQLPTIGSTIPSLIVSSLLYLLITKLVLKFKASKTP